MTVQTTAIRPLTYSDLPQVLAIERRSFPTPWSLSMFVLELSRPSSVCLAVTEEDREAHRGRSDAIVRVMPGRSSQHRLLGYLICARYASDWHIMNIAVDPSARRRGIATALLEELFARAGTNSAYTLEVRTSNGAAIALYERFGFRGEGVRKRYYQDTGEDALIMWRLGGEPPAQR
ncbi:MAG: ribosomal protein S18-alanine N-acetyltransferase [Solirubrobacterales bacterium]|nr:ribosomal protein S18-alanine N-acetyltransferase [Solirubrobacterales bacterium]